MKVQRSCMRDQVRNAIVARIVDGVYAPGTRLKELTLAAEFNVSQAPVREALRELAVLGLVESERYRGTRVRAVTAHEMREAYELRARLEEAAAELAVRAGRDALEALQADVDALLDAARRRDLEAYARHNLDFHRRIVALSGNRVLLRVWESLGWDVRSRITLHRIADRTRFLAAAASHGDIVAALRAGDGRKAGRLLREHAESFIADAEEVAAATSAVKSKKKASRSRQSKRRQES
jgi:DNA-binding GntR family transcriptional regulator